MKIGTTNNLFTIGYSNTVKKTNTSNNFVSALHEQLTSAETKKAEDMTEAIKALDKALEQAEKENQLSKSQVDWLRNRYDIKDMAIQKNITDSRIEEGNLVESRYDSLSEENINLLNDLHELGILSDRDMEILNSASSYLTPLVLPDDKYAVYDNDGNKAGWLMPIDDKPSWQKFFDESLNPNWRSDIVGYYRALAERDAAIFEMLDRRNTPSNPHLIPDKSWYEESSELNSRLSDIFEQIFN